MATAGGGSSLPTSSAYGAGGGGVGGKFQKRAFSRSRPTPYARPLTAHRNSNWISKLFLDPASKLVAACARRFFSSVFRKRLPPSSTPPLLPPPVANPEFSNGLQDSLLPKHSEAVQTAATADSQNLRSEGSCGISELEQLLKQKTFTRHEIDRLTELLQSKAVDLPVTNDVRRAESSALKPVKLKDFLVGNMREREGSHGIVSTPGTSARALEEDIMPQAELVKAYVGSRPAKESSMLSFHGQAIRENRNLLSNLPSSPNSSVMSLERMATGRVSVRENCFPTPRSRGRSAIFRMARAPYLLMHPTPSDKVSECNGNLLHSPTLPKLDDELGWKQPGRKRSSAVLDDDVGSIRRIRGRRDLVSHEVALPFGGKDVPDGVQQRLSLTKYSFKDNGNHSGAKPAGGVEDTDNASTSYCHVPPKSSETASRLLQNVEKTAQKEKTAESKLIADREKSPSKLTTMLSGQDLKSRQSADSLKLLQGAQNREKLEDLSCRSLTGIDNFNSQKQKRAEENGPKESDLQPNMTRVVDSDTAVSAEHKLPNSVPSSLSTVPFAQFAVKKHAFMMSVCEDFLDLDEDTYCNRPAAESSVEERGEQKTVGAECDPATAGKFILDKTPAFFETRKTHVEPITVSENSSASVGGCATSFVFPTLSLPGKSLQSGVHPPSSSLEKPKYVESSFASVSEVSTPKFSFGTQPMPSSSNRSGSTGNLSLQVPGSELEVGNLQEGVKGKGKPEISVSFSSSISSSISSSFLPNPSNIKNGPSAILSSPLASASFGNQASVDAHSAIAPTSVSSTVATPADTSATSSSLTLPALQFGSSDTTSLAVSLVSFASDAEVSTIKNEVDKEANVASASMSPFVSPSVVLASTGNSLFGLGSHDSSTGNKSQFQGTGSESMLSRLPSESGSVVATVSQSIPSSSSTSFSIGTSGVASVTCNTAPFISSMPANNLFGSSSSSGLSNLTSSSDTFGSGLSSNIFSSSSTVSTTSSEANAVTSVSGSIPTIFNFGAGSSGTASSSMSAATGAATFGISSSSETNVASTSGTTSTLFGSSWQTPNPSPFGSTFNSSASNMPSFGASSTFTAPSTTPMVFGASASSTSPGPMVFGAANASTSLGPMVFGAANATTSPGPVSSFATASSSPSLFPTPTSFTNFPSTFMGNGNHDQMNAEDSMAEDPVQSPIGGTPVFGQQSLTSPGGFPFGSMVPPAASPFQLGVQQNQSPLQSNPLQGPGSFEINHGGNFSLGSAGGEDKSNRRFVKVNKNRHRKR